MRITHQGWNEQVGVFHCDVFLDESRADHEIQFPNDVLYRQETPFLPYERDWDQTGEPYPKVGAFFGHNGTAEFFTPLELASLVLNGRAVIPGLRIEDRQGSLNDRIQSATRRAQKPSPSEPAATRSHTQAF